MLFSIAYEYVNWKQFLILCIGRSVNNGYLELKLSWKTFNVLISVLGLNTLGGKKKNTSTFPSCHTTRKHLQIPQRRNNCNCCCNCTVIYRPSLAYVEISNFSLFPMSHSKEAVQSICQSCSRNKNLPLSQSVIYDVLFLHQAEAARSTG